MKCLANDHWLLVKGLTPEQFAVMVIIAKTQGFERSELFHDDYQQCTQSHAMILINGQLCLANELDIKDKETSQLTLAQWFFSDADDDLTHIVYNQSVQVVKQFILIEESVEKIHGARHKHWLDDDTKRLAYIKPHWVLVSPLTTEYINQCAIEHLVKVGVEISNAAFAVETLQQAGFIKNRQ